MASIYLAAEEPSPLNFVWAEFVLVLIIFLVLLWLISKYVVPMFEKSFEQRRDAIEGGIERAEAAQREAAALLRQYQHQLSEARTEAAQIRDGARAEGQRIVEEMRANAQAESDRIVSRGEQQLASQRSAIVRELRTELGGLAVELSERIIGERLADDAAGAVDRRRLPGRPRARRGPDHIGGPARMIGAASRQSLANLDEQVDAVVRSAQDDALEGIAGELYDVSALLAAQPQMRRMLSETSTEPASRRDLAARIFQGKVSDAAFGIVSAAVGLRWSGPWDLTDAIEIAADRVLLELADRRDALDAVEDQLFRFGRIVDATDELRSHLDEETVPAERRVQLLDSLLSGKADPVTIELLERTVRSGRKHSVALAVDGLLNEVAWRRQRATALVRSAAPLTDQQTERLSAALREMYGRDLDIRVEIDRRCAAVWSCGWETK
jgi:F-type H+-transporting ATPase subunit delta